MGRSWWSGLLRNKLCRGRQTNNEDGTVDSGQWTVNGGKRCTMKGGLSDASGSWRRSTYSRNSKPVETPRWWRVELGSKPGCRTVLRWALGFSPVKLWIVWYLKPPKTPFARGSQSIRTTLGARCRCPQSHHSQIANDQIRSATVTVCTYCGPTDNGQMHPSQSPSSVSQDQDNRCTAAQVELCHSPG